MSKTRNLSDLLDANGDVKSGALDNVPASNDASALTTGTLPNARLSAVPNSALANSSITINGSATSLGGSVTVNDASDLTTGTLPDARLSSNITTNDGTQTLTNKTIASSQLTGALPALDGSALTGIGGIPSGVIAMWSGSSGSIPSGWNICDGTNGTPNLTDKFIKASGTAGTTGGSTTSGATTLSISQIPSHNHSIAKSRLNDQSGSSRVRQGGLTSSGATGQNTGSKGSSGSHTHSVEPPYYTLIFIMKA